MLVLVNFNVKIGYVRPLYRYCVFCSPVRHPEELAPIFVGMLGDRVDGGVVCPQLELFHLRLVRHSWCPGPPVLGAGLHAPPPLGEHRVEHQPALGSPGDMWHYTSSGLVLPLVADFFNGNNFSF